MSTTNNKAFVRRYLDAINGKDKPAVLVDQFISDADAILKQHIAGFEAGFPHYELKVEDLFGEEDKVAVRFIFHGVQKGEFMGIPATHKEVNVPGIILYRIAEGKIVDHWMQVDAMMLMQQLGVKA